MENNQQKAHETAYGSSVISPQPIHAPSILSGPTLPGTGQLCGPCKAGGWCPVHGGGAAGAPKVLVEGEERPATLSEKLAVSVAGFLDEIFDNIAERAAAKVVEAIEQERTREANAIPIEDALTATMPWLASPTAVEERLRELQRQLAEQHINAFVADGETDDLSSISLMVAWRPRRGMYVRVLPHGVGAFRICRPGAPEASTFGGVVDYFLTAQDVEPEPGNPT